MNTTPTAVTTIPRAGGCTDTLIHIDDDRTRGIRGPSTIDLETCRHPEHLRKMVKDAADSIDRFFRDDTWPLHLEVPGVHEEILTYLANLGLALAQLTAVVEDPPEMARIHAEVMRDVDLVAHGFTPLLGGRP